MRYFIHHFPKKPNLRLLVRTKKGPKDFAFMWYLMETFDKHHWNIINQIK